MAPLIVQLSFLFAYSVLTEATLSFLGVGAVPPTPTWGNIMAEGRQYMTDAPWIITIPGAALMITVLGLNLLGDGLRDVLIHGWDQAMSRCRVHPGDGARGRLA